MIHNPKELSEFIKHAAIDLGFDAVGISKADEIDGFSDLLKQWLNAGYHAEMQYMERNFEKRCNPTILVENAKSVVSLLVSYYPNKLQPNNLPQVSKYAYGTDYHFVLKDKMQQLWHKIEEVYPSLQGRMFVDSAPVSDKLWAVQSGLGWIGKNSCLINKDMGSFVFICELIINAELAYDEPYRSNFCGSCTKCIDACPTGAIVHPGVIDSNKCISYHTIENKESTINSDASFENRMFGCDICQDVCPWNKTAKITNEEEFNIIPELLKYNNEDWLSLVNTDFNRIFKTSALKRAKISGVKRNVEYLIKKEQQ